ncbi:MAG: NAD(P)-binding protein, partial [Desulfobacca sp.]|uniref:NAD(P)-binding protein n=1 Tax=Desulfobacca sp. TaxID=2067990 RepID=UPI004048FADB
MTDIFAQQPLIRPWEGDNFQACHRHFCHQQSQRRSFPSQVESHWEVVVVGGGLSGLTAGYHLRNRRVLVLEAGDVPGGVCRRGCFKGLVYPAGSAYFYYPEAPAFQA